MTIKYIETTTKFRAAAKLKDMLTFYGLDVLIDPNKILPAPSGGQLVMRNLTNLNDRELQTSLPGLRIQKKIGEHTVNTNNEMLSIGTAFHKAFDIASKAMTAFQTVEDFYFVPATTLSIGNNIIIVAERAAKGNFGAKFVILPKALQTAGKNFNWLTKKGNAIGLALSIGTFTLDRIAGEPVKCSSVFDLGMSAAPVIGTMVAASGGTFGVLLIFVSGLYAGADLAHQLATGESFSKYLDIACDFVANAKPVKTSETVTAQQMLPNSNDFARFMLMNQPPSEYQFNR